MSRAAFVDQYATLEERFRSRAEEDGDVYLPNLPPREPVDFIFIAMEPSLKSWARSLYKAADMIARGFRNFSFSVEDFLLHFAARRFLCQGGETYYMTDVSKGAMPIRRARETRSPRWGSWYGLLMDELDLVAKPEASFFAVGRQVERFLRAKGFQKLSATLLHYSRQAARHRRAFISGREAEFAIFARSVALADIVTVAREVLEESATPRPVLESTVSRIRGAELTTSRRQLLYAYKTQLERWH